MQPMLNIAVRAARRAGEIIIRSVNRVHQLQVRSKDRNDFVTDVDTKVEQDIIETIRRTYPDHSFLAEESGATAGRGGSDEFVWIIDPLDGTTNFLHGFPQFAVSLGVQRRGKMEHAVVYDPMRQELFTASRGDGAQVDGKRIRVTKQLELDGALIGTGFPYRANRQWLDAYMDMLKLVMQQSAGVRRRRAPTRIGRAGLGLCCSRPSGRILGIGPGAMGYSGRHVVDHRSRRHGWHVEWPRIQPRRTYYCRHTQGVCRAGGSV
jgi:myo-inositol-1(or 4)-monophosphatase